MLLRIPEFYPHTPSRSGTLKFIFSHSALKEGWDNPNVFQICNFSTRETERWRRQTIGRGLRLCVNQNGERLRGFEVNTLTVIATETYQQFAENLQKDIERDTGIQFGVVQDHEFAAIAVKQENGELASITGMRRKCPKFADLGCCLSRSVAQLQMQETSRWFGPTFPCQ